MRVVFWGTYDLGKPRVRILREGLRVNVTELIECRQEVWGETVDKSQIHGFVSQARIALKWLLAYPRLIIRYMRLSRHDIVFVGYLGHLDVLILWPFAKLRGVPIVWDAFLSLYGTVVEDRRLIAPSNPLARALFALEWLACHAADRVILDTRAHAKYFGANYGISEGEMGVVYVGVEPSAFPAQAANSSGSKNTDLFTVVFYGLFIPLHGIGTIYEAAKLAREQPIRWVVIGAGQEAAALDQRLRTDPLPKLERLGILSQPELLSQVSRADVCLGIFGDTDKAARVIPNKVFQVLQIGRPLITRDSPAIRELLNHQMEAIFLVPPADPTALYLAVLSAWEKREIFRGRIFHQAIAQTFRPADIGRSLVQQVSPLVASEGKR